MEQLYPKEKRIKDKSYRPWRVEYYLVYDGGGVEWTGYYRSYAGAKIAAWWNYHVRSWGGRAALYDNKREYKC